MNIESNEHNSSYMNTGGAYIGKNVNTEGGGWVGRDSIYIEQLNVNVTVSPELYSCSKDKNTPNREEFTETMLRQIVQDFGQVIQRLQFSDLSDASTDEHSTGESGFQNRPARVSSVCMLVLAALLLAQIRIIERVFLGRR